MSISVSPRAVVEAKPRWVADFIRRYSDAIHGIHIDSDRPSLYLESIFDVDAFLAHADCLFNYADSDTEKNNSRKTRFRLPRDPEGSPILFIIGTYGPVCIPLPLNKLSDRQLNLYGMREYRQNLRRNLVRAVLPEDIAEDSMVDDYLKNLRASRTVKLNRRKRAVGEKIATLAKAGVAVTQHWVAETKKLLEDDSAGVPSITRVVTSGRLVPSKPSSQPTTEEQKKYHLLKAIYDLLDKQYTRATNQLENKIKIIDQFNQAARIVLEHDQADIKIPKLIESLHSRRNEISKIEKEKNTKEITKKIKRLRRKERKIIKIIAEHSEKKCHTAAEISEMRKKLLRELPSVQKHKREIGAIQAHQERLSILFQNAASEFAAFEKKHPVIQPLSEQQSASLWGQASAIVAERRRQASSVKTKPSPYARRKRFMRRAKRYRAAIPSWARQAILRHAAIHN